MKTPLIKKLNITELISAASHLSLEGKLEISDNNLVYLDVDDAYIHRLFPLLQNQQIKKPDYFWEKSAGAHITVIYPEEVLVWRKTTAILRLTTPIPPLHNAHPDGFFV